MQKTHTKQHTPSPSKQTHQQLLTSAVLHAEPHDQRGDEAEAPYHAHHDADDGTHTQGQGAFVVVPTVVGAGHRDGVRRAA